MTNLVKGNFLDVTFNLKTENWICEKPNDELKCVNVLSNHPTPDIKATS